MIFSFPAGMSLTKLSKLFLAGNIKIIPARESLVSDIPAGNGEIDNLFLTEYSKKNVNTVSRLWKNGLALYEILFAD